MNPTTILLLAFAIGVIAGLRALTAPAVVAWAAHRNWLHLHGTPLSFMGAGLAVLIFTLFAVVELITDQLGPPAYHRWSFGRCCCGFRRAGTRARRRFRCARRNRRSLCRLRGTHSLGESAECPGFRHCDSGRRGSHRRRPFDRHALLKV